MKNPIDPMEMKPETLQLVAQCLDQQRYLRKVIGISTSPRQLARDII